MRVWLLAGRTGEGLEEVRECGFGVEELRVNCGVGFGAHLSGWVLCFLVTHDEFLFSL